MYIDFILGYRIIIKGLFVCKYLFFIVYFRGGSIVFKIMDYEIL